MKHQLERLKTLTICKKQNAPAKLLYTRRPWISSLEVPGGPLQPSDDTFSSSTMPNQQGVLYVHKTAR